VITIPIRPSWLQNAGLATEVAFALAITRVAFLLPRRAVLTHLVAVALSEANAEWNDATFARRAHRVSTRVFERWPLRTYCLERSLVLVWLLRRHGVGGNLRIGVKREGSELLAHAWVELMGQPLGESAPNLLQFDVLEPSTHSPVSGLRFAI